MAGETLRAFLAVQLQDALKTEADQFVERIRKGCAGFRLIPPENWHLTLHFLGQVEPQKIEELISRIPKALTEIKPFTLSLEGFGAFPNPQKPRVLWIGVSGDTRELLTLKSCLDPVLEKMHFEIERRTYHAHITIGRARRNASARFQEPTQTFKSQNVTRVDHLTLFRSDLLEEGAQYTPIHTFPFGLP